MGIKLDTSKFAEFPMEPGLYWSNAVHEVQKRTSHTLAPHPPPILFEEAPVEPDEWEYVEDGQNTWPTDLLGRYYLGDAGNTGVLVPQMIGRRIEIYPKRLSACARDLGLDPQHLTLVVVVHELMHALLHTGDVPTDGEGSFCPPNGCLVNRFMDERLDDWRRIRGPLPVSPVLELHAQLGTWHMFYNGGRTAERLKDTFIKLMAKQPPEYQVDDRLRCTVPLRLWFWMHHVRAGDVSSDLMRELLEPGPEPESELIRDLV